MKPSPTLLQTYAPTSPVAGSQNIFAHQATDVFALWLAWEAECKAMCDVPYWAIVWPAALVLSQYIGANPSLVQGKSVLDCGCGGGVVAIAAANHQAARSMACDVDPVAIDIACRNAAANNIPIDLACQDVIDCCNPNLFNLILVADLFYQSEFSVRLFKALQEAHAHGSDVIIADSGRPFLPKEGLAEIHCQSAATSFDVEGCLSRTVRLYRFA